MPVTIKIQRSKWNTVCNTAHTPSILYTFLCNIDIEGLQMPYITVFYVYRIQQVFNRVRTTRTPRVYEIISCNAPVCIVIVTLYLAWFLCCLFSLNYSGADRKGTMYTGTDPYRKNKHTPYNMFLVYTTCTLLYYVAWWRS